MACLKAVSYLFLCLFNGAFCKALVIASNEKMNINNELGRICKDTVLFLGH